MKLREPELRLSGAARGLVVFACLSVAVSCALPAQAAIVEVSSDGAWSWFSDPRALWHNNKVYVGWVTKDGDVQVAKHDLQNQLTTTYDLAPDFQPDDHDYPAFYVTSDGRMTAFYSKHAGSGNYTQYRTMVDPWGVSSWFPQRSIDTNTPGSGGATYSNPFTIPGETNRIYLFWRGGNWKPCYTTGVYNPELQSWTWERARTLIYTESGRPYVKYAACESGVIGLAFTSGHPYESDSRLYYAAVGKGKDGVDAYFRSDGSMIKTMAAGPLYVSEAEVVYDGSLSPNDVPTESWVWDIAFDDEGHPTIVFASFPSKVRHRYHWARFDGETWQNHVLVENAGGSVADTTIGNPQYYYSGGIALDHTDVGTVYLSRANDVGGWDLERWKTTNDGASWSVMPITTDWPMDNMRPVVPENRPQDTEMVLWMSGVYDYYANLGNDRWWPAGSREYNYDTAILLWIDRYYAGVEEEGLSSPLSLRAPSPNPFHSAAALSFELAAELPVRLEIFDVSGRLVRTLLDANAMAPGLHRAVWDGRDNAGAEAGSGVYFGRLSSGDIVATGKMVLMR